MVQGIDLSCDFNGFQASAFPNLWNACELYTHLPYGYSTQPDTGTIFIVHSYRYNIIQYTVTGTIHIQYTYTDTIYIVHRYRYNEIQYTDTGTIYIQCTYTGTIYTVHRYRYNVIQYTDTGTIYTVYTYTGAIYTVHRYRYNIYCT